MKKIILKIESSSQTKHMSKKASVNPWSQRNKKLLEKLKRLKREKKASSDSFNTEVDVNILGDLLGGGANLKNLSSAKTNLQWSIEFEYREWGIKSIYIHVPDQTITIYGETENEGGEAFNFPIQGVEADFTISEKHNITPQELTYWKGKWSLEF